MRGRIETRDEMERDEAHDRKPLSESSRSNNVRLRQETLSVRAER